MAHERSRVIHVVRHCVGTTQTERRQTVKAPQFKPAAALIAGIALTLGALGALVPVSPALAADAGSTYVPLSPTRILDTRDGTGRGGISGPIPAGGTVELTVTALVGVPATGVEAVTLNVTATNGTALDSYLTVFPTGAIRPLASNLNFNAGKTVPNLVMARVGNGGKVTIYNNSGTADVVADLQGWYASPINALGSRYVALEPARVLDTRLGLEAMPRPVPAGGVVELTLGGRAGIPDSGVTAVVLNVTAVGVSGPDSFVTVYPSGTQRPLASNLNVTPGQTVPNAVVARVNNGKVSLYNNLGEVHLIADVQGWFKAQTEPLGAVSSYNPVAPVRALDTRDGTGTGGVSGLMGPGGVVVLQVAGTHGIPAGGVTAVVLNVTVTNPTGPDSFLTVYLAPGPRPLASNLNFRANQTVANLVVARVGPTGAVALYNNLGAVHMVADVQGWFHAI
jgi:hypothetical protein